MDSNSSSRYLFEDDHNVAFTGEYYVGKPDSNIIDLGLSLRVVQPETCYSSGHGNCEELVDWHQLHPSVKRPTTLNPQEGMKTSLAVEEESEGVQSNPRWTFVKVNMDGVLIGRKVCIFDDMNYLSLASRLEDMFGKQTMSGLRLFQADSLFCLFYKDKEGQWRTVGDVPWKEFVDRVRRMRIVFKDEPHRDPSSLALLNSL